VSIADAAAPPSAEHEALIQFLYLAPVGLVQATSDGEIGMMNPISAQLLMPLSRDASLTNLFTALENVAPELRHLCSEFTQPSGMVCDGLHIQLNACSSQDKPVPQVLSLSLLKLDASRLMAVLKDVTQQVRRERQLRQSEAWFNAILHGITDYALVALDRQGRISEWNESIGRVTRFGDAVVGAPYSIFYPKGAMTAEHLLDRLREADGDGWSLDEGRRLRADGSQFWCSAMIAPLPESDTPLDSEREAAYCLILRDISDKREASEKRRRAIFCDHLTGLANRRAFFDAAELELGRSKHAPRDIALILFDADHFKAVNDRFGHPAGDAVLRHLADTLADTFREVDVVARIGGEEFAVLLPSTDLAAAAAVAERLRALVEASAVTVDAAPIRYTVSAGVAVMSDDADGLDGMLKRADLALYAAKAAGRNRVHRWDATIAPARPHSPLIRNAN
jgi:diguanylate cyclase (GGDEF)-like protein/PAS domain S-box-containing protein